MGGVSPSRTSSHCTRPTRRTRDSSHARPSIRRCPPRGGTTSGSGCGSRIGDALSSEPLVLFGIGVVLLFLSGLRPFDRLTWALEVAPILIAVPVLFGTSRRFPLTPLVYRLIFLHAVVLMIGGHYTYERVPVGFWFRDVFHLSRNHYDRFGHLVQGFVPAIIAREVLLRVARLRRGALLFLLVTSVCLA